MRLRAIHQFSCSALDGDGSTNGMFFIQRILRDSGIASHIYAFNIDSALLGRVRSAATYQAREEDLVLVHYSLGSEHDEWIERLEARKVLIYHNITPASFFAAGTVLKRLSEKGRKQLAGWARSMPFVGAIADSEFNAAELRELGYPSVAPISLLVDLDRLRQQPWTDELLPQSLGLRTLLFVGRICENKGQLELVHMFERLRQTCTLPVQLLLVGGTTTQDYEARVRQQIERANLSEVVHLLGKRSDAEIVGLYRHGDAYVSLSQHEGFGMPLVEAMAFDLPVVAAAAGSVAATLGRGGLVLADHNPAVAAAAVQLVLEEPALKSRLIRGQRQALQRFEPSYLVREFETYLRQLGFEVHLDARGPSRVADAGVWTVEGPFDSSYSLAVVNREFARALERSGKKVALASRDGPGPYAPSPACLAANADIATMAKRHDEGCVSDVALRLQFPPHMHGMRGPVRVLANYAWEESGFPFDWVRDINAEADLVTVTSTYVAKVLRDNGVQAPIVVTGNGVEQVLLGAVPRAPVNDGIFRFLHISSCFPRKGIDALLAAWGHAFSAGDPVELIIKTFPNPHNVVKEELLRLKASSPNHAPIRLINEDLPAAEVRALIFQADAIVCPSRGEGFCLPLAEGLALGKSIVTTGYGGQMDYCSSDIAWLCDYRFSYAKTHLDVPTSVWVDPDVPSLTRALVQCAGAPDAERSARRERGQRLIMSRYTWDEVSRRTQQAIDDVSAGAHEPLKIPTVAWVTSWNSRCGIADYARSLTTNLQASRLSIFADSSSTPLGPDEDNVIRCWRQSQDETGTSLLDHLNAATIDAVVVQYNFGFFSLATLGRLIEAMRAAGKAIYVTLHSTADVHLNGAAVSLRDHAAVLARANRILVHSLHDLNRLKSFGLVDNVTLFPMGMPQPPNIDRARVRRLLGWRHGPRIASFGYLLPHKGLRELIAAFSILLKRWPGVRLTMLNSLYPAPQSTSEYEACRSEIDRLGLAGKIELCVDFLPEEEIVRRLAAADVLVYPYQTTQESASAAIKMGLGSGTVVACTPLEIFDDVRSVCHILPERTSSAIATGLSELLSDTGEMKRLRAAQERWAAAHSWPVVAQRLEGLIRGEACQQHFPSHPTKGRGRRCDRA